MLKWSTDSDTNLTVVCRHHCLQTTVRLVSLSVLHFNTFSIINPIASLVLITLESKLVFYKLLYFAFQSFTEFNICVTIFLVCEIRLIVLWLRHFSTWFFFGNITIVNQFLQFIGHNCYKPIIVIYKSSMLQTHSCNFRTGYKPIHVIYRISLLEIS